MSLQEGRDFGSVNHSSECGASDSFKGSTLVKFYIFNFVAKPLCTRNNGTVLLGTLLFWKEPLCKYIFHAKHIMHLIWLIKSLFWGLESRLTVLSIFCSLREDFIDFQSFRSFFSLILYAISIIILKWSRAMKRLYQLQSDMEGEESIKRNNFEDLQVH